MTESENEGLDPRIAAMIAERQKEEDAIALDSQAEPSEEAIDPRIQAIIEERQKEEPDVELTPEQLKAAEDALIPAPPTVWGTLGENLIDKVKNASPVDAMAITGGALTGYKLPGVVNRVTPVMSGENEEKLTSVKDALKNPRATLNQDVANDLEIQHGARVLDLQDQRYMAERDLEEAAKNLKKAQLNHANVKAINIDELLGNKPTAATPAVTELTRVPIGGVAAQNYDISHGGTEAESLKAPSTSKVQKDIPGRTEAWNKIAEIAPEYERTKESPLLLNPNEQKYKLEQLNQQSKQEAQQEGLKKKMQEDLAKRQAKAQKKLEDAQKAHDESLKAIRKIEAELESHKSSRPVSAEQKRKASVEKKELDELEKWRKKYEGGNFGTKGFSAAARLLLPRFSPVIAGAMAPEQAIHAKELYDKGEYKKAMAYGASALGSTAMATGIPWASGVGALAQLPAIYYEAEDMMTPKQPAP